MKMYRCLEDKSGDYQHAIDCTRTAAEWFGWAWEELAKAETPRYAQELVMLRYIKGDQSFIAWVAIHFDLDIEECAIEL